MIITPAYPIVSVMPFATIVRLFTLPLASANSFPFLSLNANFASSLLGRIGALYSNVTETSSRVSPGGSVNHLGSLDSLAKVKIDSTHPLIAQEETNTAAISRYFFAPGQSLDCGSQRIIEIPCLLLQGPIIGRRRASVGVIVALSQVSQ